MKSVLSFWIFDWRKLLAYSHRWLGIVGYVLFVAWFVSGVVMMYARMPGLANEERLARAPALDLSRVRLSPTEAASQLGLEIDRVQVGMLQGPPVYRFGGREQTIIFADNGEFFGGITRSEAQEIARRYAPGHTGALRHAAVITATDPDQWTLQARARMPMHRFDLDDPDDTHLYVSEVTGDVVLRTTRAERFWGMRAGSLISRPRRSSCTTSECRGRSTCHTAFRTRVTGGLKASGYLSSLKASAYPFLPGPARASFRVRLS
jgi:hypothetical protein